MKYILVFCACFMQVGLLVFQSLNVNRGRYASAFFTSISIGTVQLYVLTTVIPNPQHYALPFVFGSAFGSIAAMKLERLLYGRKT